MKKIFFISAIIVALLFAGAVAYFFYLPQRSASVFVEFYSPGSVRVGEPFALEVNVTNSGDRDITNGKLYLSLPEDIVFVGMSPSLRVHEVPVGDIGPRNLRKETFRLLALEGSQSIKHVEAKLTYGLGEDSRVQYESSESTDLAVGQPAVSLSLVAPQRVFSGENFDFQIVYENNSDYRYDSLTLKIDYPPVFQFVSSTREANRSNNTWALSGLGAGERGEIRVTGSVVGPEQSFFAFRASLLANVTGQSYTVTTQDASVAISTAPLSVRVSVGDQSSYTAEAGESLDIRLSYRNNSSVAMENVTISATLIGEMLDFEKAKTLGFFNSLTNTFFWNAANTPALRSVAPGQNGVVQLNIVLKSTFPAKRISDKNFVLKIGAKIESPTVPEATEAAKTVSLSSMEIPVAGLISIAAEGYFRDAASGILNTGPFPPRVNQPTQYTIHWIVKNYSTDVRNVLVSAYLHGNTRFTGQAKSSLGALPSYNPASGEVSWKISSLPATKGVVGEPVEIVFQIENIPAVNEKSQTITLLNKTIIEAEDMFTGRHLTASALPVTTAIPDDRTVTDLPKAVQP